VSYFFFRLRGFTFLTAGFFTADFFRPVVFLFLVVDFLEAFRPELFLSAEAKLRVAFTSSLWT